NGVAIIAHGGSSPKAIKNAIRVAKETVSHDVNRIVIESLESFATVRGGEENKFSRRVWSQIKSRIETFSEKPITDGEERETKGGGKV
ncbi:MAG: hypothetical protein O7G28_06660, partial [Deltaproteobacteria bacterium]|nr:hypothetical protein [Deltaproteobacteria bacterium]